MKKEEITIGMIILGIIEIIGIVGFVIWLANY